MCGLISKSDVTCWNCGDKGHKSNNYPKEKNQEMFQKHRNGQQNGQQPRGKGFYPTEPPENGKPNTKTVDGKTWYWCKVCRRWNLTHNTEKNIRRASMGEAKNNPTPPVQPIAAKAEVESPKAEGETTTCDLILQMTATLASVARKYKWCPVL